jgi:hypothetical protein
VFLRLRRVLPALGEEVDSGSDVSVRLGMLHARPRGDACMRGRGRERGHRSTLAS